MECFVELNVTHGVNFGVTTRRNKILAVTLNICRLGKETNRPKGFCVEIGSIRSESSFNFCIFMFSTCRPLD